MEAGWYLPDFWLPAQQIWVEIKGQYPLVREDALKIVALARHTHHPVMVLASPPSVSAEEVTGATYVPNPQDNAPRLRGGRVLFWFRCPVHEFARAALAARSARFEHGETPQPEGLAHA